MPETQQTKTTRLHPDPAVGLSARQVEGQIQKGLHNGGSGVKTKTEGQIIRENVFTFFNLLNFALAAAVILVGSPPQRLVYGGYPVEYCHWLLPGHPGQAYH